MNPKGIQYYLDLDLVQASQQIRELGPQRARNTEDNDAFADASQALLLWASRREVTEAELREVLGEPDEVRETDKGAVLCYHWTESYGSDVYTSSTPYLVKDGIVIGHEDEKRRV